MAQIWILTFLFFLQAFEQVQSKPGYGGTEQEWGTIEIRPGAHAFYWLYYVNPPVKPIDFDIYSRPLIIWLQGGPGYGASGIGNFLEIGPIDINGDHRNSTWVNDYNVLFIDAPVGSGFSHADSHKVFNTEDSAITDDVVSVIKYFLEAFPKYQRVPMYIVGQSYGAKVAVNVAWELYRGKRNVRHNLKGIGLGSPAVSPLDALQAVPSFAYHMSFIDAKQKDAVQAITDRFKALVEHEKWVEVGDNCANVLIELWKYTQPFDYNHILQKWRPGWTYNRQIIENINFMNKNVKPALNITHDFGSQMDQTFNELFGTYMKPAVNNVERLLKETNLKVAIYSGQLDLSIPTTSILTWLDRIFEEDEGWRNATRTRLIIDDFIEGYQKHYDNLSMYWVFRAGHWAPQDNPAAVRGILQNLIES